MNYRLLVSLLEFRRESEIRRMMGLWVSEVEPVIFYGPNYELLGIGRRGGRVIIESQDACILESSCRKDLGKAESLGTIARRVVDNVRPVQSYELLSLASMPREEALEIAERSARQFAARQKRSPREIWNYRCDLCFCNALVYQDNNLCFACDHGEDD